MIKRNKNLVSTILSIVLTAMLCFVGCDNNSKDNDKEDSATSKWITSEIPYEVTPLGTGYLKYGRQWLVLYSYKGNKFEVVRCYYYMDTTVEKETVMTGTYEGDITDNTLTTISSVRLTAKKTLKSVLNTTGYAIINDSLTDIPESNTKYKDMPVTITTISNRRVLTWNGDPFPNLYKNIDGALGRTYELSE